MACQTFESWNLFRLKWRSDVSQEDSGILIWYKKGYRRNSTTARNSSWDRKWLEGSGGFIPAVYMYHYQSVKIPIFKAFTQYEGAAF